MVTTQLIETPTHGRVLIDAPAGAPAAVLVAFHGYAQSADDMLAELKQIPGSDAWTLVSVQALHRFYARGDEKVVASWMTRQDREQAIADNLHYVDRVLDSVRMRADSAVGVPAFVLGFSQGAAMAYRAGVLGRHTVAGVIAIGGDVPPDTRVVPASRWPRVLVAAGASDHWFTPEKVAADEAFLRAHGVVHEVLRYDAGHMITDEVRARVQAFVGAPRSSREG